MGVGKSRGDRGSMGVCEFGRVMEKNDMERERDIQSYTQTMEIQVQRHPMPKVKRRWLGKDG